MSPTEPCGSLDPAVGKRGSVSRQAASHGQNRVAGHGNRWGRSAELPRKYRWITCADWELNLPASWAASADQRAGVSVPGERR